MELEGPMAVICATYEEARKAASYLPKHCSRYLGTAIYMDFPDGTNRFIAYVRFNSRGQLIP